MRADGRRIVTAPKIEREGDVEIDFKARAQVMHRRAQQAEGWAIRLVEASEILMARCDQLHASARTLKRRLRRAQAQLQTFRIQNQSSLERIIELGRLYP